MQEYLTIDDFDGKKWLQGNFVAETIQRYELRRRWYYCKYVQEWKSCYSGTHLCNSLE